MSDFLMTEDPIRIETANEEPAIKFPITFLASRGRDK